MRSSEGVAIGPALRAIRRAASRLATMRAAHDAAPPYGPASAMRIDRRAASVAADDVGDRLGPVRGRGETAVSLRPPARIATTTALPRRSTWTGAVAALAGLLLAAAPAARPLPEERGDAIPDIAIQRAVTDATYAYFAEKDGGRYDAAYRRFASSVRSYLTPELYRSEAANFAAAAGRGGERRIVTLTWERDPPEAPAPGLYVAADFVSRFPGLRLHCGYLMWRQEADGVFRIVREEQSFLDEHAARAMTPERLATLPQKFGCPGASAALE